MDDALVIARVCLAAVFIVAGVAKLGDRPGTRKALADFGVPHRLAGPLVFLLPATELASAIALMFPTTARWGAAGCLLLLVLFITGLTRTLLRGEAPDCHCFGQLHNKPASWATVARNLALAVLAAYVTLEGPGPSFGSWVANTSAIDLALIGTAALATVTTATSVHLWRKNRRLSSTDRRVGTSPRQIGALAPQFSLPSASGGVVSLHDLLADDRACLLTFVSAGCGPCAALLPELARWHDTVTERLTLTLVAPGEVVQAEALAREHALADVLIDERATVMHEYGVWGTPSAVLVAPDGTVRSPPVDGRVAIESLIRLALQDETQPAPVRG